MAKKKVATKKVVPAEKKPVVKKTEETKPVEKAKVEVTIKRQVLGEAPEEYHFVLADGKKLKSLYDLANALGKMTEDTFKHHVTEARNDFSNWINDVFKDEELAKDIQDIKDRTDAELRLLKHFVKRLTSAT